MDTVSGIKWLIDLHYIRNGQQVFKASICEDGVNVSSARVFVTTRD